MQKSATRLLRLASVFLPDRSFGTQHFGWILHQKDSQIRWDGIKSSQESKNAPIGAFF